MSYIIEPMPLISFIEDTKIKLPRFQRKATWEKKQNFELCISVFQDYPVGVVIVNKEQQVSWLLDGRQRRNALKYMRENPVELYDWARNYIGFSKTADPGEIEDAYWDKVEKYLQTEEKEDKKDKEDEEEEYEGEEDEVENSFNSEKQKEGLKLLLKLILMVHQVKPSGSYWERQFDFSKYCLNIKYQLKRENYAVNPSILRSFLLEMIKSVGGLDALTMDAFINFYDDTCSIKDDEKKKFEKEVEKRWDYILDSLETIQKSEKLFEDARIGIITLTNCSPLDAQNIFSRINRGGTLLKAEELLSAKPYWNVEVDISDPKVKDLVKKLYDKLGVETPQTIVRWDLAATLISRIDKYNLIFDKEAEDSKEMSMTQVTLGFKVISSWFKGGMSGISVSDLERDKDNPINWEIDIADLVADINTVCDILANDSLFKFLQSWNRPMSKMLGNAITLEFLTIVLKDWNSQGRPMTGGAQYKAVQRNARILFDRLVFEYATKVWRGSGDSKMAADIKDWNMRIQPIDESEWKAFISGSLDGIYHGQKSTQKTLTPVLYYYYSLKDMSPLPGTDIKFDVDHIIPQEKFKDNQLVNQNMKDSLSNLALLPKKDNISKSSKALNEISDTWLKNQIVIYSNIQEKDFDKYSDISNIDGLKKDRGRDFTDCFTKTRSKKLSN